MKVLVLGGRGYLGSHLVRHMQAAGREAPTVASRQAGGDGLALDVRDAAALARALRGFDAVINCVAGSAAAIAGGARALAQAAPQAQVGTVVHLSSLAVYGEQEGTVDESSPFAPADGWYGRAKQAAEASMRSLAAHGARVTVLRPGCVWGPGSLLWLDRIVQWLGQGRLGDLGEFGDGWTHGVLVDDVCEAVVQALRRPAAAGAPRVLNLAAPDSPRWNTWFTDLALATGAIPLRRIAPLQLRADAWLLGPVLHGARHLLGRQAGGRLPFALTPGLLRLWQRQLRMDSTAASRALGLAWTPYPVVLARCVASCRSQDDRRLAEHPA